jgi:hypothetical protein
MSRFAANTKTTTLTTSAAETTIVTADPNTENLLTALLITCITAAAIGTLTVRDATGAAVAKIVFDYPATVAVPTVPVYLTFDPPLKQDTKNTAWTIQSSSASNSFKVTAFFVTEE